MKNLGKLSSNLRKIGRDRVKVMHEERVPLIRKCLNCELLVNIPKHKYTF
jgi:hypothetical protein